MISISSLLKLAAANKSSTVVILPFPESKALISIGNSKFKYKVKPTFGEHWLIN